jgi:hypothetical protein
MKIKLAMYDKTYYTYYMKTNTVHSKLGHFRSYSGNNGEMIFQSRANLNRIIKVFDQSGNAIAIPCFVDESGQEVVAFHAKTIKSLIEFLKVS